VADGERVLRPASRPVSTAGQTAGRHHAGAAATFELDRFRILELGGRSVGVVRTGRGFFAVHNRCPHQGAEVCAGLLTGGTMVASRPHEYVYTHDALVVVCPWHRWEFDLETGRTIGGISSKRLAVYAVEVLDDQVYVRLPGGADGA
jgi:nitrite reductase (NADH) small subunit